MMAQAVILALGGKGRRSSSLKPAWDTYQIQTNLGNQGRPCLTTGTQNSKIKRIPQTIRVQNQLVIRSILEVYWLMFFSKSKCENKNCYLLSFACFFLIRSNKKCYCWDFTSSSAGASVYLQQLGTYCPPGETVQLISKTSSLAC